MQNFDVAVVGGGAAGLTCALELKRGNSNISVVVIDSCDRLGKKLAATGNGQGNVSNTNLSVRNYHGGGAQLAFNVIGGDYKLPERLFNCLFTADGEGRMYPSGRQASALVDSLMRELSMLGARLIHPATVTDVSRFNGAFALTLSTGCPICAGAVVLACGGKAQKQFGTNGGSYVLAQKLGHTLTPLVPSLVQLRTDTSHIKTLKGIRVDCKVRAFSGGKLCGGARGDLIFTDYGVSGNAVFKISSVVAGLDDCSLAIEFLPDVSKEEVERDVRAKLALGYPNSELLSGTLHNQLGRAVIKRAGGDQDKIASMLKNFVLPVTGTLGFDYAQVTRGGIDCADIGEDMQSKLVKNLYLVGEYLDVDGDCGGYNLLWGFASGVRAAKSMLSGDKS